MADADPGRLDCEAICAELSDYLDRELTAHDRARVAAHLAACPGCERLARDLAAVVRALHALGCRDRA